MQQQLQVVRQSESVATLRVVDISRAYSEQPEVALQVYCSCQREMTEDFDNCRMVCKRCGNRISLQDLIEIVGPIADQARELAETLAEAIEAYLPPLDEDEDEVEAKE